MRGTKVSKALVDPRGDWQRVSPKLVSVLQIGAAAWFVVLLAATAVPLILKHLGVWPGFPAWISWVVGAGLLVWWALEAAIIPRRVKNMRYTLRDSDLGVARGVLFHESEVVPYGRVQYVDLKAGPLLRAFGLCQVQVHTASPDSHPVIHGLPRERGEELKDELAKRGEERLAGL